MRHRTFLAAVTAAALLAVTSYARGADTVLLGGVGSNVARFATDAPTMTLKGMPGDDATVEKTHWGYYRPWFRPWGYGYYRPWLGYGFYRPWLGYGFYRPWLGYGFYRPWLYRPWVGISYAYAPNVGADYSTVGYVETEPTAVAVAQRSVPAPSVWPPAGPEALPIPVQTGGFRYDGSPLPTVPPAGVTPPPAVEPPSNGRAAPSRLVSQPPPKRTYPAYGEPPAKPEERANSVRVNSDRQ